MLLVLVVMMCSFGYSCVSVVCSCLWGVFLLLVIRVVGFIGLVW